MISKHFIKSSVIYSVIGALPLATSFVLLPFYTNLLSTDDFGMLMIYIIFSQLIQIFFNFGLDNFLPINYIDKKDDVEKRRQSISTGVVSLLILGVFIIGLFAFTGDLFFNSLNAVLYKKNGLEFFPWGFMSVITAFFNSFFKTYVNLLVYQQRPARFFWMNIFNFIITIAISVIGIYMFPYTLIGPMWGRLLSGVGIFLVTFFLFGKEFGFSFHKIYIPEIVKFCYPLVLYLLIYWVVGNIDRYIILYFMSPTDVAIFDFAIKCTLLLEFFQNGLTASIQPKIFNIWKSNNLTHSTVEVNRYYNGFTAISLIVLPMFLIAIPLLVPLFVTKSAYYESFAFLALLSIGFATRGLYAMFLAPILFYKKTKVLPKVFLFSAIFQITVNIYLIKYYGLMGAVWTSFLVKYVQVIFLYWESKKIFLFKFNITKIVILPLFYTIIVIILNFLVPTNYLIYSYIFQLILLISVLYIVYRTEVRALLTGILNKR